MNRGSGRQGNGDWCLTPAARWHLWKNSQGEAGFQAQIDPFFATCMGRMIGKEEGADRRIRNNSGIAQITLSTGQGQSQAVHTHVSFSIFCIFAKAGVPMPISSLRPFCRMDSRAYVTPALLGLRMLKDFWRDPSSQPFVSLVCWCLLTAPRSIIRSSQLSSYLYPIYAL